MFADQTAELPIQRLPAKPCQWSPLSVVPDAESLIGFDSDGRAQEWRMATFLRDEPSAMEQWNQRIALLDLASHFAIRQVVENGLVHSPPWLKLGIATNVDLQQDRLANRLQQLSKVERLTVAAIIVDALNAAHHVGLYHGALDIDAIWTSGNFESLVVQIDFCTFGSSPSGSLERFDADADLVSLQRLLRQLLDFVPRSHALKCLGGRDRVVLSKWLAERVSDDEHLPTLSQWQSILGAFLPQHEMLDDNSLDSTAETTGGLLNKNALAGRTHLLGRQPAARIKQESLEGVCLGRFRLLESIGEGGMGVVYRAVDQSNQQTVAVKVLRLSGSDAAHSIRRFRKEARLLADAENEHVTKLIDVGHEGETHYLAMEFIEGVNLKDWLAHHQPIDESTALRIMEDLSHALVDAHARGVIHRDLKPENVLLKLREQDIPDGLRIETLPLEDFTLKLTDFGIARHAEQSESMEVTKAGAVIGTPRYMSPEQCRAQKSFDPSADVYSLGITFYELLTGDVPFVSDDLMRLAGMHCFDAPTPIQQRNARVTDGAARIVHRCLQKKPADRFGDASQLLTAIREITRGQSSDIEAHPRMPDHDVGKLWSKTVSWQLKSKPADLWPLVSNTERLNEAIGLPSVEYRTEQDPELGTRKFGEFTLSGIRIAWEEHPFEWIEGKRMGILREFETGPFKWFLSTVTLQPTADGGTELSHRVQIEPRNLIGRILTTVEADWKGFRNLARVYDRMDRAIQGRLTTTEGKDAFKKVTPLKPKRQSRLRQRMDLLSEQGVSASVVDALTTMVTQWSEQELAQIRPLAAADRLKVDGADMIDACLLSAAHGILTLGWDVLCPTCRAPASRGSELSDIESHTHCQACDVDFRSNLGDAIEMVFRVHAEIRDANTGQYCIGGPEHSPHVVAQLRVAAGECLQTTLDLPIGDYLIRGPRLPRTQMIKVQDAASPSSAEFVFSRFGSADHTIKLRSGSQCITLMNDLSTLHVVRIERMIPRDDVVTATMATANPLFQKLFPRQTFAADNPISSETMSFVATTLNETDRLYDSLSDEAVYRMVNGHLKLISEVVVSNGGNVVKTIGESLLAVFPSRDQALLAARHMRAAVQEGDSRQLSFGIGVHCGPTLVTTQNNRLDYFGSTVRAVLALPQRAGNQTLVTAPVFSDPGVREVMADAMTEIETMDLPGTPNLLVSKI
ncbi:protein kinase domain-containing protein [Stieleria varia]|nr:protein kinase [Stieleria varia]